MYSLSYWIGDLVYIRLDMLPMQPRNILPLHWWYCVCKLSNRHICSKSW